jgi:predicted HAD superfamily Cof-like phosphohydrolase
MTSRRATYLSQDAVRELHTRNGALIHDHPPAEPVPIAVGVLRLRLIAEEYGETCVALHEGNLIEAADGLADLLYVVLGTAVSYGVPVMDGFETREGVHLALPDQHDIVRFIQAGAALVHDVAVGLRGVTVCQCGDPGCGGKVVKAKDYDDLQEILQRSANTIWTVSAKWGIPLEEIFGEVHRANMTKTLGGAGTDRKYGEGGGKGATYTPPDVAGILQKAREGHPG